MTAKIAANDAGTSQVDQFTVVTARPRLGTWSIVTSRVEGAKFSFAVILYSLLTKQQPFLVPSTREVTIDYVPSLNSSLNTFMSVGILL